MSGSLAFSSPADELQVSLGQADVTDAFSVAIAIASITVGESVNLLSDDNDAFNVFVDYDGTLGWWNGDGPHSSPAVTVTTGASGVACVTKDAGVALPRLHWIPLPSGAALHGDSTTGTADDRIPATPYYLGGSGVIMDALAVGIRRALLTDTELEALTSWAAFAAAFDLADGEAWELDGTAPFAGSGTSTQVALSGTSHSASEPAGFWGGAVISRYNGSAWADCPLHRYDGSAWAQAASLTVA